MAEFRFYETVTGRCPATEFLARIPETERLYIMEDIRRVAERGRDAAVSVRSIRGYLRLFEIKTLGFRTFCAFIERVLWVFHICKKQDQERGIQLAYKRMKEIL